MLNKLVSNKQKVNGSNKDSEHRSVHGAKSTVNPLSENMGTGAESKRQSPRALRVSLVSTAGSFEGTGTHSSLGSISLFTQLRLYWTELCQRV